MFFALSFMQFSNRLNVGHVFILLQAYFVKVMPAITLPARERNSLDGYFTQPDGDVLSNIFGE